MKFHLTRSLKCSRFGACTYIGIDKESQQRLATTSARLLHIWPSLVIIKHSIFSGKVCVFFKEELEMMSGEELTSF